MVKNQPNCLQKEAFTSEIGAVWVVFASLVSQNRGFRFQRSGPTNKIKIALGVGGKYHYTRCRMCARQPRAVVSHFEHARTRTHTHAHTHIRTLAMYGTRVHFKTAVIATGSSPFIPPPYREMGQSMIDNEGLFDMEDLPESILVVGTGVIGLELGQSLHRLGVRVTILGRRGVVGPISDPVVRQVAERVFSEEMDFRSDHTFESVRRLDNGRVELQSDGRTDVYDKVLMAAGRRPNVMDLGLENVGLDPQNLPTVDPRITQLGPGNIFIAGDVSSFRPLLHEAADEGRIAGMNAANHPNYEAVPRRTALGVVFSDPQIATVGLSWSEVQKRGHCTGEVDYSRQGRARVMGTNKGWVRIYGDCQDGQLLGAEMFGPATEHTAHLLAWAIAQRLTVYQVLEMPFYHPVVEEGIRTALQDLRKNLHFPERSPPCKELKASM